MCIFSNPGSLNASHVLQLFNLQDEQVQEINITHKKDGMYVYIKLAVVPHCCPVCDFKTKTIKGYTTKKIVHSLTTHVPCYILYKARRFQCDACGKSFYEHNPFAYQNMKISSLTVYNVLTDLKQPSETFTSVAHRYHISPTTAASLFDAHVFITRRKLPEVLCIDEVYGFSSNQSQYVCVLVDFKAQSTVDLLPSRKKEDLLRYLRLIPLEERKQVKIVSIDMWLTYRIIVKEMFPSAVVSLDKFHVYQELLRKITLIRVQTMNKLRPTKVNIKSLSIQDKAAYEPRSNAYYLLKKFHWLLVKSTYKSQEFDEITNKKVSVDLLDPNAPRKFNRKLRRYANLYEIKHMLLNLNDDLTTAINLYYLLGQFYKKESYESAKERLDELIHLFHNCGLPCMVDFSNTLKRWKKEIVNSFIIVDKERNRKVNNGIIENRNKIIKQMKHNSNGYRNWDRFRNRALYVLNEDTTYHLNPMGSHTNRK